MLKYWKLLLFAIFVNLSFSQTDLKGNWTPNYDQLIEMYTSYAKKHSEISLFNMGLSDFGKPIYVCVINGDKDSLSTFNKAKESTTLLINNAIHPGEPDGVNACLLWMEEWIKRGKKTENLPVIAIIPSYNVGGMHNRSSTSRANQVGPEEYGFRGNASNLDLNRDFIKMDSENMKTFAKIYHALDPDVFIDNHVSNGADYQHILSYIAPVKERIAPSLSQLIYQNAIPSLASYVKKKNIDLVPYIDMVGNVPDSGIRVFDILPRYSSGYTDLFQTIGFTVETHMLKPFPERVQATLFFMEGTIQWMCEQKNEIELARAIARNEKYSKDYYHYNYQLTNYKDSLIFKGYKDIYPISEVTETAELKYDRNQPWEKYIPHYNQMLPNDSLRIPSKIIIPANCTDIVNMLELNKIDYTINVSDDRAYLNRWYIDSFQTFNFPYEGHYLHYNVHASLKLELGMVAKGDYVIEVNENNLSFLMNVFNPEAKDSYFSWNFFDSYLQQKEHFSSYVFDDIAIELLEKDAELKIKYKAFLEENKMNKLTSRDKLNFIYINSPYYESTARRLPYFFIY